jgi:DNA-binding NtrC family response regulator
MTDGGQGQGFELTATMVVRGSDGVPRLRVREFVLRAPDGEERRVGATRFRIGSHPGNDLVLKHRSISRFHLEIEACAEGFRVRDLDSTNGTWLNGVRIHDAYLPARAMLRVAQQPLEFALTGAEAEVPTSSQDAFHGLLGGSPAMREVLALLARAAASDVTVLLEGESGTGKERAAWALHAAGRRAGGPFVVLDCAALPATLLESELFGHERGAFTGAVARSDGRFREAHGGTLLLDEIGELPLELQPKLLRAIETKVVRRLGSTASDRVDVRLVAATNRDLAREVNRGSFREDLYYRLAVVRVTLPPLRARREDIRPLVAHFVRAALADDPARAEQTIAGVSEENWQRLEQLRWPGNVRELRNFIERTLVLSDGGLVADVPAATPPPPESGASRLAVDLDRPFTEQKHALAEAFEREYLLGQLARHGNISAAARAAGMDRMNFKRLLRRYQ